jgi:hypothetical protein
MPLVNLKRAEIEKKGTLLGEAPESTEDDYTYGLRIHLEEPELQKLGLNDPEVGSQMPMVAVMKVVSYSKEEKGRSMTLLITDLGLPEKKEDKEKQRAVVMYGNNE